MSEKLIIEHCSPTLAGLKTGNLFTCPYESEQGLRQELRQFNKRLTSKGLRILPLRCKERRALIYLYRPGHLRRDLSDHRARALLHTHGYLCENPNRCVARLMERLRECEAFPHEIGLFLGYPPEDVLGFIENRAECFKCVGYWKVYGDEEKAQKLFQQFKRCTSVYCDQWAKGKSIERLTVAV